ncbi:hypothetical protein [Streptomyces sp. NPDC001536]|uniref:hypothetical protein n=1 Tax=Streptomyces sp. NPDC001536 TaxID=3364583 RepID=UPI003684F2E3
MRRSLAITTTRATTGTALVVVLELVGVVVALGLLIHLGSPATPTPRTSSRRPTTTHRHTHGLGHLGGLAALRALRHTAGLDPVAVRRTHVRLMSSTVHPHLLLGDGIRLSRVRVELLG